MKNKLHTERANPKGWTRWVQPVKRGTIGLGRYSLRRLAEKAGKKMNKIYGYYDRSDQLSHQPTINPAVDGPCLFCGETMTPTDVRTHSMMGMPATNPKRAYFYRTHRTCHEDATSAERADIDGYVWQAIKHYGD